MLALCTAFLICSCQEKGYDKEFLERQDVSLCIDKKVAFEYNPVTCQLAYNDSRREYRAVTDNMSDYFVLRLSAVPSSKTETVTGTLSWTGEDYIKTYNNLRLEVVKMTETRTWLWSQQNKVAIIIPRMEAE